MRQIVIIIVMSALLLSGFSNVISASENVGERNDLTIDFYGPIQIESIVDDVPQLDSVFDVSEQEIFSESINSDDLPDVSSQPLPDGYISLYDEMWLQSDSSVTNPNTFILDYDEFGTSGSRSFWGEQYSGIYSIDENLDYDQGLFADVDGDNVDEFIYVNNDKTYCVNNAELGSGNEVTYVLDDFYGWEMTAGDIDGDYCDEIWARRMVSSGTSVSCEYTIFDHDDFESVISDSIEYTGYIPEPTSPESFDVFLFADIDGDGVDEFVVGGALMPNPTVCHWALIVWWDDLEKGAGNEIRNVVSFTEEIDTRPENYHQIMEIVAGDVDYDLCDELWFQWRDYMDLTDKTGGTNYGTLLDYEDFVSGGSDGFGLKYTGIFSEEYTTNHGYSDRVYDEFPNYNTVHALLDIDGDGYDEFVRRETHDPGSLIPTGEGKGLVWYDNYQILNYYSRIVIPGTDTTEWIASMDPLEIDWLSIGDCDQDGGQISFQESHDSVRLIPLCVMVAPPSVETPEDETGDSIRNSVRPKGNYNSGTGLTLFNQYDGQTVGSSQTNSFTNSVTCNFGTKVGPLSGGLTYGVSESRSLSLSESFSQTNNWYGGANVQDNAVYTKTEASTSYHYIIDFLDENGIAQTDDIYITIRDPNYTPIYDSITYDQYVDWSTNGFTTPQGTVYSTGGDGDATKIIEGIYLPTPGDLDSYPTELIGTNGVFQFDVANSNSLADWVIDNTYYAQSDGWTPPDYAGGPTSFCSISIGETTRAEETTALTETFGAKFGFSKFIDADVGLSQSVSNGWSNSIETSEGNAWQFVPPQFETQDDMWIYEYNSQLVIYKSPGGYWVATYIIDDSAGTPNHYPEITSTPPLTASINTVYRYDVNAIDQDGDTLTYTLEDGPNGMIIEAVTNDIVWTPTESDESLTYTIIIRVEESPTGASWTQEYDLTVPDERSPTAPIVSSPSHNINEWSNHDDVIFTWNSVIDTTGVTYHYCLDLLPDTDPSGTTTNLEEITFYNKDDGEYYFHIRAIDGAGNWGATTDYGPIKIDASPPGLVDVSCSSHTEGAASSTTTALFTWDDLGSDVEYLYSFVNWEENPTSQQTDQLQVSFADIPDGAHYFNIRGIDRAGNLGSTTHFGPIVIDTQAPIVIFTINGGATWIDDPEVDLAIQALDVSSPASSLDMRFINDNSDWDDDSWEDYSTSKQWTLSAGDGEKRVSCEVRDELGHSSVYSQRILLLGDGVASYAISPIDGDFISSENVIVEWEWTWLEPSNQEITETDVMLATDPDFFNTVGETYGTGKRSGSSDDRQLTNLNHGQTYYWKVCIKDNADWGTWSLPRSFTIDLVEPDSEIDSPIDGASISGNIAIEGKAFDDNFWYYTVSYAPESSNSYTTIETSYTPMISTGTLATLDTNDLFNGLYNIKLHAWDLAQNNLDFDIEINLNNNPSIRDLETTVKWWEADFDYDFSFWLNSEQTVTAEVIDLSDSSVETTIFQNQILGPGRQTGFTWESANHLAVGNYALKISSLESSDVEMYSIEVKPRLNPIITQGEGTPNPTLEWSPMNTPYLVTYYSWPYYFEPTHDTQAEIWVSGPSIRYIQMAGIADNGRVISQVKVYSYQPEEILISGTINAPASFWDLGYSIQIKCLVITNYNDGIYTTSPPFSYIHTDTESFSFYGALGPVIIEAYEYIGPTYEWVISEHVLTTQTGQTYQIDFTIQVKTYTPPPVTTPPTSSCPYLYSWIGEGYEEDNDIIHDSEYQEELINLVTDRYILSTKPALENDSYKFAIAEFEAEYDIFDSFELYFIDHTSDTNIALDTNGNIRTYGEPEVPLSAFDKYGMDYTPIIANMNGGYYDGYEGDYIDVTFDAITTEIAKLIIRSDAKPGSGGTNPPIRSQDLTEGPIRIQIQDQEGLWQDIDEIHPRNLWAIDIVDVSNYVVLNQPLTVRLYWDSYHKIDYIALDTTQDVVYDIHQSELQFSNHTYDGIITENLKNQDGLFTELYVGDSFTLVFSDIPQTNEKRDFMLVSTGYYCNKNYRPYAEIEATPTTAYTNTPIYINALNSEPRYDYLPIDGYKIYYGDGQDSGWVTFPVLTHEYAKAGTYNITVLVKDICIPPRIDIRTTTVTILNRAPIVDIGVYQEVDLTLWLSGQKGNTATLLIFEDGVEIDSVSLYLDSRWPISETYTLEKYLGRSYEFQLSYDAARPGSNNLFIDFDSGLDCAKPASIHAMFWNDHTHVSYNLTYSYDCTIISDSGFEEGSSISTNIHYIDEMLGFVTKYNHEFYFDASKSYDLDGVIVDYSWDFGDGTSDTGVLVVNTYETAGTYTVTLTIIDDDGSSSSKNMEIIVKSFIKPPFRKQRMK